MSRNQIIIVSAAVVIVVLALIAYFFVFPASDEDNVGVGGTKAGIQIMPTDRTMGSAKAPVVLLEYAAPSCPHCARFETDVFPLLKRKYIDTGKVYYVFRVFPISAVDGAAEAMARCLPADNYFAFIDLLFRNQKQWDPEYGVTDVHGGLVQMGRIAGMSAVQVDQCISDKAAADRINKVAQDGVAKYNINGTPTLVINGAVQQAGEVPWPILQNILDKDLSGK